MNDLIKNLKILKSLGVVAVKQSFEDEGASQNDIAIMRIITTKAKLPLNVKVGGCEATNDIYFCKKIKVNGIVAPMVESEYALTKFIELAKKGYKNSLYINIETKSAFENIEKIIKSPKFKYLKGIVIGRSDFAGSLSKSKNIVDSKQVYQAILKLLKKIKKKNILVKMGGSITNKSKNFIKILYEKKLLNRIETRNIEIVLNKKNLDNLDFIIEKIFNFELQWIEYKLKLLKKTESKLLKKNYISRIAELKRRIKV